MRSKLTLYIIMCILLSACNGGKQNSFLPQEGDTLSLRYAENIRIVKYEGYSVVTLLNPWKQGETLSTYILTSEKNKVADVSIEGATVVEIPLKKALVGTAVHCALFEELDSKESVAGVCDAGYINLWFIKDGIEKGRIMDCGNGMQPNTEKVIALQPDAIFLSPYQGSTGYGKVEQAGLPIIELADYMETSPLGRAEWMLFYGMLLGKEEQAARLFAEIEGNYLTCKALAAETKSRKSVLMDKMLQATWFLPGGESTIGRLLKDANCDYVYADTEVSGSVEQSFEQVLQRGDDADLWLLRYNDGDNASFSLADLGKENAKYKLFKAYKTGEVYACQPSATSFFETTPFHPERLLRDFILITHPETEIEGRATAFYRKLALP